MKDALLEYSMLLDCLLLAHFYYADAQQQIGD